MDRIVLDVTGADRIMLDVPGALQSHIHYLKISDTYFVAKFVIQYLLFFCQFYKY